MKIFPSITETAVRHKWFFLLLAAFTTIQAGFISGDLWNDEIYTFKYFVLQPFSTIVTDYHVPNNHILQSLLYKTYVGILGIDDLFGVLNNPFKLRILQLVISVVTLFYLYKFAALLFNRSIALLAVLVLVTTIPYNNFALQIRGYNLSMMLMMMILYVLALYFKNPGSKYLLLNTLLISLLVYTIPSNLYFVMALFAFLFIITLIMFAANSHTLIPSARNVLYFGSSVAVGVLLSLIFFYPVLKLVFFNEYVLAHAITVSGLFEYFPAVLNDLISNRHILLVAALLFTGFNFKLIRPFIIPCLLLLCLLIIPFGVVFVSGHNVPDRVFVTLSPVFALLCAVIVYGAISFFKVSQKARNLMYVIIVIYLFGNLYIEFQRIDRKIAGDIVHNGRSQDLYYNYYLAHFQPLTEMKNIQQHARLAALPVFIKGCEPHDIPHYLEAYNMTFYPDISPDKDSTVYDSILVVTNQPTTLIDDSVYSFLKLSKVNSYHTFFLRIKK